MRFFVFMSSPGVLRRTEIQYVKDKIGIGIIGTGFARRVQIPAFLSCQGAALVSIASGNIENARAAAVEFEIGHVTADWRETIAHPDADLVCITTPPKLHREMTLFALEQGKHVLCEKPMAMNTAEAEEMAAAAAGKPLLALIDHELRFQPGRQRAYAMIREGVIGKIRHAKAIFRAPHRGDPSVPWNWWSDAGMGGGALGAIASHIIDSFQWFLDADISSVSCQLQTHIKERRDSSGEMRRVTSDDESNMLLRFADGDLTEDATGIVSVSMTEFPRYQNRLEFYGTAGSMRIDHRGELSVAKSGDDNWTDIEVDLGEPPPARVSPLGDSLPAKRSPKGDTLAGVPDTGFSRAFMAFAPRIIDALRGGKTCVDGAATFDDGVRIQRVLDAARESDASKRVIDLSSA